MASRGSLLRPLFKRGGRPSGAPALAALILLAPASASAQVLDADLRATAFYEPSATSQLTVLNPEVGLAAKLGAGIELRAGYEADIVSGATEAIKGGPLSSVDVVSSATDFDDTRHIARGGFSVTRESTELAANYGYGVESDYRSHSVAVSVGTTFLQRNSEILLSYARSFDKVCTTAFDDDDAPSARLALDASRGCFTSAEDRDGRDVTLDDFQVGWTQTWTPVFATQLVLSGALQNGFLGNPYRAVVIAPAGDQAVENHPENRGRAAISLRGKLYVRPLETAFGLGARVYRDTWDVLSTTVEVEAERYIVAGLRIEARARYYTQTGALFWSDDYTGGEPQNGPRGQYWTGDRELSPLDSWMLGGRFVFAHRAAGGSRLAGILLGFNASAGLDVIQTNLEEFTWGGVEPDDTFSAVLTLGLGGDF